MKQKTADRYARWWDSVVTTTAMFILSTVGWLLVWAMAPALIGWQSTSIRSGSMEPSIAVGDIVVLKPGHDDIAPGRVVVFTDPSDPRRLLTHRLVSLNDDGSWQTQGDSNSTVDLAPVPTSAIVGTARLSVPYAGYPALWKQQGEYGKLAVTVLLLMICGVITLRAPRESGAATQDRNRQVSADGEAGEAASEEASCSDDVCSSSATSSAGARGAGRAAAPPSVGAGDLGPAHRRGSRASSPLRRADPVSVFVGACTALLLVAGLAAMLERVFAGQAAPLGGASLRRRGLRGGLPDLR